MASGKNTVAAMLAAYGASVIDADQVSRDLVVPGSKLLARLVACWGGDILDAGGALNRKVLAARVFGRNEELRRLNAMTHPAILEEMRRLAGLASSDVIVLMAPLLLEAGCEGLVDEVWVVTADEDKRVQRILARDGGSEEEARARMAAQIRKGDSIRRADVVIENNADLSATERQVEQAWRSIRERLRKTRAPTGASRQGCEDDAEERHG